MKKIYLSPPSLGKSENRYIKDAIKSNWIAPVGPFLDRFENRLKTIYWCRTCAMC